MVYTLPQIGLEILDNCTDIARVLLKSLVGEDTDVSTLFEIDRCSLTSRVLQESGRGRDDLS